MIRTAVLNGPNLQGLGHREPEIYGSGTNDDLMEMLKSAADRLSCSVEISQASSEGLFTAEINRLSGEVSGLIVNPGGYSHTSVAVLDAMRAFRGPVVEVHVSQIHRREPYRHRMLTAGGADAVISGAGLFGYVTALEIILYMLRR
jgi:3-dehydroquinate dehydratase II